MKKINKSSAGFTLIELLVVIAIIGILASIVLASLSSARNKGSDAAIEQTLVNARSQAGLFFVSNSNKYLTGASGGTGDLCSSTALQGGNTGINALLTSAAHDYLSTLTVTIGPASLGAWNKATCHASATAFAAEVPLKASASGSPVMWCIDSAGTSKQETTNISNSGVYQYACQ